MRKDELHYEEDIKYEYDGWIVRMINKQCNNEVPVDRDKWKKKTSYANPK